MESPKRAPPHPRRALLFSTAFASVALLSGVVYGWPAMRRILRRNRVLAEGCTFDPATGEPFACNAQELRLGLVYTLGSYANNFSRFPIGIALDRVGPRVTVLGSCVTFALGAFVFAFTGNLAALSTGYVLIGTGGAGLQLALQSTAVLFPLRKLFRKSQNMPGLENLHAG
ncbi:hypothetical protein T492DRAFT_840473 [Pavlovales sp. CCMP2436]|nr:hypothetical protein T492DRAFT_840473 [Pavlovales sp. CCMP2436]